MTTNDKPVCDRDVDLMCDVYMTREQRAAYNRILDAAMRPQPAAPQVPEGTMRQLLIACINDLDLIEGADKYDRSRLESVGLILRAITSRPECPCGDATCEEPWEPGCGFGRSEEHVRVADPLVAQQVYQSMLDATPPAPEPDEDDYESDDRFVGHLYANAPEQPKPAIDDVGLSLSPEQCAEWLDAKYRRHGEIEDKVCADTIRRLSAKPAGDVEAVTVHDFIKLDQYLADAGHPDFGDARMTLLAIRRRLAAQPAQVKCWCLTCRPQTPSDMRFVVCPTCGNKRCPHANDHRNACTGSNEVGQPGSSWEHVKPAQGEGEK